AAPYRLALTWLRRGRKMLAFHHHHGHVIFATRAIGGFDQFPHGRFRFLRVLFHRAQDDGRRHLIAQAVAAQYQRAIGVEREALHFDETLIVGSVFLGPNIAEHLIAPRMAHGFGFAQLAIVLALPYWRVVVRDLA